jgi:hypothetical protein
VVISVVACAQPARAYDFDIWSETIGQGYQLRTADNTLVDRRRITEQLGLEVYNLGPKDVMGLPRDRNQFYLSVMMRLDAELGDFTTLKQLSGRTEQEDLQTVQYELLWAYLGGHNLGGFVDFKLGRQIFVDLFEWRAFDGLSLQFNTPFHVALEVWGGLNVSGDAPVDSPLYRVDGVALGGNPLGSLAARQEDALQPTFGLAAKTIGLRDLQVRISYLRTMSFTEEPIAPCVRGQKCEADSGVIEEKAAVTARGRLWNGKLVPWFGLGWDVLNGRAYDVQAGLRLQLGRHGLQAEYVLSAPTFDGDSIWNVFASSAFDDVRLSYDVLFGRLRGYARGFVRIFEDHNTNLAVVPSTLDAGIAGGGSLGARLDWRRGYLRLDAYYEDGYGGRKAGVDLGGRLAFYGDLLTGLVGELRLNYVNFRDDSRPIDHADSFGLSAGLRYSFVRGLTLHLALEENVNRFYDSQFRLLAMLDISFWLGPHGAGYVRQKPRLW